MKWMIMLFEGIRFGYLGLVIKYNCGSIEKGYYYGIQRAIWEFRK